MDNAYMGQAAESTQHMFTEHTMCSLTYCMRAFGLAVTTAVFKPQFYSCQCQNGRACDATANLGDLLPI